MESLFYALGILLSGAYIFHFFSQFGISVWLIYFVVGKMWPFMADHQPWNPIKDKIDDAIDDAIGDQLDNLPSLCGSELTTRRKGGSRPRPGKHKSKSHGICEEDGWDGDPLAMIIIASLYMVLCLLLLAWTGYIFARIVRLGRRQQGSAVRTVLHLTANRLATPAFAAVIFLAWYLVWGFWTWFAQCRPLTNMSYLNFANSLLLTVPTGFLTLAWVVGTGCEIAWHIRSQRQDDIPLPNLGPGTIETPALDALVARRRAEQAAAGGGGGGDDVSTIPFLLRPPPPILCFGMF